MPSRYISASLLRELTVLATWLTALLLVGAIYDSAFLFLFLGLLVYLLWTLYNLNKLTSWLAKPTKQPPEVTGIWDEVYYQIYYLYKRQRKARRKLTSMLNRFQKSTQALPYATIIYNELNEIEWFNPAASQLFNLHANIDIGQRIDNLIRQPGFINYLQKKNFSEPLQIHINQKKISLSVTAYGGDQYLISARDITTYSKMDAMRRDFISNASHELRTPLTVISGYIETLLIYCNKTEHEPLEKIQEQIARMNKTIAELIELARLESSASVDYTVTVDTKTLLNDVYNEALSFDNGEHHIVLEAEPALLEGDARVSLHGSYNELRMAFSNLLTNAVRYTPEGGEIILFFTAHDTCLSVGVKDNGVGIDYEHIPRLTERFYRVDAGRSREVGGTGLGLSIVKHVLDRHNATLHVQSSLGKGSIFRCDFPLPASNIKLSYDAG